jgi:Fe-S cluster assembly protein SufD
LANGRSESSEPEWLSERRRKGASLARELELPTQKEKGWEFTDLADLDLDAFSPAEPSGDPLNGSRADGEGPVVLPLDEAADRHPDLVRERLGSLVSAKDPFVARNEANWRGGALVYVPAGQRLEKPVRIEALQKGSGSSLAWRTLVVLGEDAEAEVWESYRSADDELVGLFNGVVELIVGPGARLRYVCGQELSERSWVFASQRATVERDGSLEWVALGFGSARGKVRMETDLAGQGANAKVTGAYAGTASQHLDYDTTQEHAAPHTTSDLAFRGVLAGKATAVWRGMIKVDPGAQRTDAFQESRNLLLSQRAHADAIPGLEIEANDVRCTHAAAVAQLDPDQLFYLRSHGLEEATAKRLVIEGFLQALVDRLPGGTAGELVSAALGRRLSELLASS